eukprot:TRINITY_DN14429_c0_g2_i7.p1 TRINITY_DN14429_c0_g2~~TRINITY_DN14429_c0_g2_i7.p1  ORF type:complete len:1193 (+),score=340.73 TRINITY_DN14429_c0_g2_i7:90-3581(+)
MTKPAAFLFALVFVGPASGNNGLGSVYWEWWRDNSSCEGNSQSDVLHHEWTSDLMCLHSAGLQPGDPLRDLPRHLFPDYYFSKAATDSSMSEEAIHGLDINVHCVHRDGKARDISTSADDDIAIIKIFNTTDRSCSGPAIFTEILNSSVCGYAHNGTDKALHPMRLHCSRCDWYFLEEAAPPYVLQGGGVFLFLLFCIIVNLLLQAYLDRLLKTVPPKILPCLFPPPDEIGETEMRAGTLVELLQQPVSDPGMVVTIENEDMPNVPKGYQVAMDEGAKNFLDRRLAAARADAPRGGLGGIDLFAGSIIGADFSMRGNEELQEITVNPTNDDTGGHSPPGSLPPAPTDHDPLPPSYTPIISRALTGPPSHRSMAGPGAQVIAFVDAWSRPGGGEDDSWGGGLDRRSSVGTMHSGSSHALHSGLHPSGERTARRGGRKLQGRGRIVESRSARPHHQPTAPPRYAGSSARLTSPGSLQRGERLAARGHPHPLSLARSATSPTGGESDPEREPNGEGQARLSSGELEAPSLRVPFAAMSAGRGEAGTPLLYSLADRRRSPRHQLPPRQNGFYDQLPEVVDQYPEYRAPAPDPECCGAACDVVEQYGEHSAVVKVNTAPEPHPWAKHGPHPMCVVCGRDDRDAARFDGFFDYRCRGKTMQNVKYNCESGTSNTVLVARQGGMEDEDIQRVALAGHFGVTAHNIGTFDGKVLCAFRRPRGWLRTAKVARMRYAPKAFEEAETEDHRWPSNVVLPKDAGADGVAEQVWMRLCETSGFAVACEVRGWTAVELSCDVHVWIPRCHLRKVADWGGDYARLPIRSEMETGFKTAGTDLWKNWYKDFELVVGKVRRVYTPSMHHAYRQEAFEQAKRNIEVHPRATMEKPGSPQWCSEYLALMSFAGSASLLVPAKLLRPSNAKEENAEYLVVPQPIQTRVMMAVFVASTPPLLALKGIALMSMFGLSIKEATSDGHSGRANNHSPWQAYEEVYFKLFNSGYPTLLADCGTVSAYFFFTFAPVTISQFVNGVGAPILGLLTLAISISLPGSLTHALPMVFYYFWFWIPVLLIIYGIVRLVLRCRPLAPTVPEQFRFDLAYYLKHHKSYLARAASFYLFFRVLAELAVVVFLQTNYNYAVLNYESLASYFGAISTEFKHRQLQCTLENTKKLVSLII